jgi:glycosyltransferase involved in cell wall biosynthesis
MHTISVVIPALNEQENIPRTIESIPVDRLRAAGLVVEILVVDNGSSDRTAQLARSHGAKVLVQPVRGYGNAYKVGFANCVGDVIATGDADLTYPFSVLPEALAKLRRDGLDFLSTDRLGSLTPGSMSRAHLWANHTLSMLTRTLFRAPFRDSQSGMWIFQRHVLHGLRMRAGGMAFSQELKVEVFRNGYRCGELPISYLPRGGQTKMRGLRDGARVFGHLLAHRIRPGTRLPRLPDPDELMMPAELSVPAELVATAELMAPTGAVPAVTPVRAEAGRPTDVVV